MSKLNVKSLRNATAITTVKLRFERDGEMVSEDFKLCYVALSPRKRREIDDWAEEIDRAEADRIKARDEALTKAKEEGADEARLREIERSFESQEERYALAELLSNIVHSLPEIVDDGDQPVEITPEELAGWDTINLLAIRDAIRKDSSPNEPASAS